MIVETMLSLMIIVPGIIGLLYRRSKDMCSLTSMQRPAYLMFYQDICNKSNTILGALMLVGGVISLIIGVVWGVQYEASFIAAYTIIGIITVSEYSYRLYLKRLMSDSVEEKGGLELIKHLSGIQAIIVSSLSVIAASVGLAATISLYKLRIYSAIPIEASLITAVIYLTLNSLKRPIYTAYPWLPHRWIMWLSPTVAIIASLLLLFTSIGILI